MFCIVQTGSRQSRVCRMPHERVTSEHTDKNWSISSRIELYEKFIWIWPATKSRADVLFESHFWTVDSSEHVKSYFTSFPFSWSGETRLSTLLMMVGQATEGITVTSVLWSPRRYRKIKVPWGQRENGSNKDTTIYRHVSTINSAVDWSLSWRYSKMTQFWSPLKRWLRFLGLQDPTSTVR